MIGQKHNLVEIDKWSNINAPQFLILVGAKGSGKRTLAKEITKHLQKDYISIGCKVDDVRNMIDLAYKTKAVYVMEDADIMSAQAKNALLKIVEEPPEDTYFIMTICDEGSILDTIRSRARVMRMESYTIDELHRYRAGLPDMYYKVAITPFMLDTLADYGTDFLDYCRLVIDNIRQVESANAFKSGGKLALKSDTGYDLSTFFSCVIALALFDDNLSEDYIFRLKLGTLATKYGKLIERVGVNKVQCYDNFVFEVRTL